MCPLDRPSAVESRAFIATLVFLQMLPATAVAPAIRPLFALHHGGREGPMHAFMSLNMLGAIAIAVAIVAIPAVRRRAATWTFVAAGLDALLLASFTTALPTSAVLGLRTIEGALHVGVTTVLMSHAAEIARRRGDRTIVSTAGAALIFAVAAGSFVGGALVGWDARAPFWFGALVMAGVASVLRGQRLVMGERAARTTARKTAVVKPASLRAPLAAAFLARFAIGCLVVSFSLYAHRVFGLSDRRIGFIYACMTWPFALAMLPAAAAVRHRPSAISLAIGMLVYALAVAALAVAPPSLLPVVMLGAGVASAFVFSSVLAFASSSASAESRARAMALVNGAGCLGMLLGPAAGGIACAVFRSAADPGRGYRAAFLVAAASLTMWVITAVRWTLRGARASARHDHDHE